MAGSTLAGTRVLLVEDEALVAMMLEDSLSDLDCLVAGVASTLNEAEAKIVTVDFDVAILDVNLNGKQTDPIARALKGKDVPFVFCTGYGSLSLPAEFGGAPVLAKPFQLQELQAVLTEVLRARG
ncbi:MAG: response regulator [Chelatococcus sp.]|nr:response regulator [Chelatococcus sp. YT9]MBX3556289.1 response regulator [Chelatococcus sp.]